MIQSILVMYKMTYFVVAKASNTNCAFLFAFHKPGIDFENVFVQVLEGFFLWIGWDDQEKKLMGS